MTAVVLATCAALPRGEPGARHLDRALRDRGVDATWAAWDDPAVDWDAPDLVCVRSTWDYAERLPAFLAWAEGVGAPMLNPAPALRWNTDKGYLVELAATGLPVVPTRLTESLDEVAAAVTDLGAAVVKPRVGASGRGVRLVSSAGEVGAALGAGPWVVQPLVDSVHTVGEVSVFVIDGRAVCRVDKRPAPGEIRVHEEYGGVTRVAQLDETTAAVATAAISAAGDVLGVLPAYGRVDLMYLGGRWVVGELELTEPGLYLDVVPGNAAPFADLVARLVR